MEDEPDSDAPIRNDQASPRLLWLELGQEEYLHILQSSAACDIRVDRIKHSSDSKYMTVRCLSTPDTQVRSTSMS